MVSIGQAEGRKPGDAEAAGAMVARRGLWRSLYAQVIAAIIAGGLIGHFAPETAVAMKPLGDAFIRLVKMVIAPVVFFTIVTGIAGMRDIGELGSVAGKAFGYFLVVSTLALVVGLVVGNLVQPGAGMHVDPASLDSSAVGGYAKAAAEQSLVDFLIGIIPETVSGAFASGNLLQVLFFSIFFGLAIVACGERAKPLVSILDSAGQAFFNLVTLFMKAAPIGAFGAFAFTIGKYGLSSIANLASLVATFYLTSAFFILVVLGAIARLAGFRILDLLRYLKAEILLVLGTSSSEAALPSLMEKMEQAGCARPIVGVVVPTGYSFNLDGTNIYMTLATLFIAQALDIHLPLEQQLLLLAVAMLSSKGAAGVTGAGFITLAATLSIVPAVPVAGLALILGIDRFMSECRALTNFIGNAVATVVVARWEGGLDTEKLAAALKSAPTAGPLRPPVEADPD
jgi:aerobic C4-dicarboxylate transport protein